MKTIPSSVGAAETFKRLQHYIQHDPSLQAYGTDQVHFHEAEHLAHLKGPGFEAELRVQAINETSSSVLFDFRPNFLLRAFSSRIEGEVVRHITDALSKTGQV